MLTRGQISLGILAGGQALRLGGADKAFAQFQGRSLLARTLDALGSGYPQVLISYNGADDGVVSSAGLVVPDLRADFPGPLAGIESLLQATNGDWLLTIPVDLKEIPDDLVESLCRVQAADADGHGAAVLDADGLQPLVALWPVSAARVACAAALDAGDAAVLGVLKSMHFRIADISPFRLGNLNAPTDFE
jgi:molybdopterin-guanine dinucleotide biosynthesis protein A